MGYKIKYDGDADVLTVILKEKGKLSHAEEAGDIVIGICSVLVERLSKNSFF